MNKLSIFKGIVIIATLIVVSISLALMCDGVPLSPGFRTTGVILCMVSLGILAVSLNKNKYNMNHRKKYRVDMFTDIAEFFDKRYEKKKNIPKDVVKDLTKFFEKYD